MPKPLKEYVQQVLAEHERGEKIRQALLHGVEAVKEQPGNGWWRRKSTRRAIIWENAVEKLIELLDGDTGVYITRHYDTISFIFDNAVLVRLKKADIALRTSNILTPQAELFHQHDVDIFGFTGLQRVEAVYVPNRFDTGIVWTGIVARENNLHLWEHELLAPVTVPVAILPLKTGSGSTASLAKLKNQSEDDKKNNDKKSG